MSFPPSRSAPAPVRLRTALVAAVTVVAVATIGCDTQRRDARNADSPSSIGSAKSEVPVAADSNASAIVVRDDFGGTVALAPIPQRVVSLNPTTTELIFALGGEARVVGRSRWDEWPSAAKQVPALGDALRPSIERVLAARPDLVVLYATPNNRPAYDRLRAAGIRAVGLRIDHIAQFERAARLLGRMLGRAAAGEQVADSVAATLDRVRSATRNLPRPSVVWPVSASPPIVIGGGSYMSELIDIAGARNVYGTMPAPSPVVSIEDVVARNPDIVIRGGDDNPSSAWSTTWSVVPAVRAGHVVRVSTELVSRPSVHLGEAAVALARALHPEAVIP